MLKQAGITLVEILIALTLGSLILVLCSATYLNARRYEASIESLSVLQHNAHVALHFLAQDIRLAGYLGCASGTEDAHLFGLSGTEATLAIKYLDAPSALLKEPESSVLYATQTPEFKPGDRMLIADCHGAELFTIKSSHSIQGMQRILTASPLHRLYAEHSEVGHLYSAVYFVQHSALYRQDSLGRKMELVPGIKKIHIRYTLRQNYTLHEAEASEVDDWAQVVGVSVCLELIASGLEKKQCGYTALREQG